jgi:protein arginine N-methyltransferase 5
MKILTVPPLSALDTSLTPNEAISQVVGMASPWIDLCSPDPLIADISRQILMLEVAYAAFCGISYLIIPGPKLHHGGLDSEGLLYYARTVQEVLSAGPYIHVHIWIRIVDNPDFDSSEMGDLAPFAREQFLTRNDECSLKLDLFGTWDAWEVIRTTCKHHSRLFVGMQIYSQTPCFHHVSLINIQPCLFQSIFHRSKFNRGGFRNPFTYSQSMPPHLSKIKRATQCCLKHIKL